MAEESLVRAGAKLLRRHTSKKRRICFSPAPTVHEFDGASPTVRRLELKRKVRRAEDVQDDTLAAEMTARGLDPRREDQRKVLLQRWNDELRDELLSWGLDCKGSNQELSERLELAKALRRRAHLRLAGVEEMPASMSSRDLETAIQERRIAVQLKSRLAMVIALEEALLKEVEGLVGDGYDFGRRFVAVDDFLRVNELSDAELRDALKARGIKAPRRKTDKEDMLHRVMETEAEQSMQRAFRAELLEEMGRREIALVPGASAQDCKPVAAQPSEPSASLQESTQQQEKDTANVSEKNHTPRCTPRGKRSLAPQSPLADENPMKRLKFDHLSGSPQASPPLGTAPEAATEAAAGTMPGAPRGGRSPASVSPAPSGSPPPQASELSTTALFERLFNSGTWREEYRSLSPTKRSCSVS